MNSIRNLSKSNTLYRNVFLTAILLATCGCSGGDIPAKHNSSTPQPSVLANKDPKLTMRQTTYLLFDGDCKQAMEFYRSVFGGELTLTTVGDSPMKDIFPSSMHARVVNARLKSAVVDISASDWLRPSEKRLQGNAVCIYLSGGSPQETTTVFDQLSEGAQVTDPLAQQLYGMYGALNDKFGIRWMFHSEQ